MKRRLDRPAPDYREHRRRWADLIALAHQAAASQALGDLKTLSERALDGENIWTPLAPFPEGLIGRVLTRVAYAYGRQVDAARRAELAPMLMSAAGMVDALLERTREATIPEVLRAAAEAQPEAQRRLPYADN